MPTREDLIKAKVVEVARRGIPSQVAFLATLLSCNGAVSVGERAIPEAFIDYAAAHGEETFAEVRRHLLDNGVVIEREAYLRLNYDANDPLFQKVAKECAEELFTTASQFFAGAIEAVMATPEGQYALSEIVRSSAHEDSVYTVSAAIGPAHWETIRSKLAWAGLFFVAGSSRKHTYYALFPELKDLLPPVKPRIQDAVAYVYIGQRIRTDGGLLRFDCDKVHADALLLAKAMGWVAEGKRFRFDTYITTPRGEELARDVVRHRLEKSRNVLEARLKEIPKTVLQFLVNEVWTGPCGWRLRQVDAEREWWDPLAASRALCGQCTICGVRHHHCLLGDERIRGWWRDILELMVSGSVAVKATDYVGTRGGETRDREYVLAPETEDFLKGLVCTGRPIELPEQVEWRHVLYHFFAGAGGSTAPRRYNLVLDLEGREARARELGIPEETLIREIQYLAQQGVITLDQDNQMYRYIDWTKYSRLVQERYFRPMVEYVMSANQDTQKNAGKSDGTPGKPPGKDVLPVRPPVGLVLGDLVSEEEMLRLAVDRSLTEDERRERLTSVGNAFYPLAVASTHTAIFGTNGSGKSVTTKRLLKELVRAGVAATIIDWHDEYSELVRGLGGLVAVPPTATVHPEEDEIPFTWNVLDPRFYAEEPTPEVIEDYVQIVVTLLAPKGLMELTEPMKSGLARALKRAYQEKESCPTFGDVLNLLDDVQMPPVTADAIRRRLEIFSSGSLGKIFCRETSLDPEDIFSRTVCIRVRHLTEDHQASVSLLVFFVLRQAISYFKRKGEVSPDRPVRHVIVIDEAPMVLGSNPYVEREAVRIVQEARKFGEGLILVCRNTGIPVDILRETNQKISHRLEVESDVRPVANMLGLQRKDLLRKLPRGTGFLRIGSNPAVLVRFRRE